MKLWLAKLRISSAINSGKPLPPRLAEQVAQSEDLKQFARAASSLEPTLKQSVPKPETPPFLHGSIMSAVKSARQAETSRRPVFAFRWLPVPVAGLFLALGLWWGSHRTTTAPVETPLVATALPLNLNEPIAQTLPASVLAPMSEELENLNRDFHNTADFLMASLP